MKRRHFTHFHVAGFTYWDGSLIFKELEIGTKLKLVIDKDNKFDAYAVALYYKEYKLGYIPRGENKEIYKFCEQGYQEIFEVVINRISPEETPEEQIGVVVFLKEKE